MRNSDDIHQVHNINSLFHFNHDDLVKNRSGFLTAHQSERLSRILNDAFKAMRKDVLQDVAILGTGNLVLFVAAANFGAYVGSLLMLAISINFMWSKLFGKYNIKALYRRKQQFRNGPTIQTISDVTQMKFTFQEGHKVYTHPSHKYWFQSYDWYDSAEMSSLGWYVFSDNSGIEIILAPHQFTALDATAIYTCYCFVDPSRSAYVLSIEEQTRF
jgi:hypothetical protein